MKHLAVKGTHLNERHKLRMLQRLNLMKMEPPAVLTNPLSPTNITPIREMDKIAQQLSQMELENWLNQVKGLGMSSPKNQHSVAVGASSNHSQLKSYYGTGTMLSDAELNDMRVRGMSPTLQRPVGKHVIFTNRNTAFGFNQNTKTITEGMKDTYDNQLQNRVASIGRQTNTLSSTHRSYGVRANVISKDSQQAGSPALKITLNHKKKSNDKFETTIENSAEIELHQRQVDSVLPSPMSTAMIINDRI